MEKKWVSIPSLVKQYRKVLSLSQDKFGEKYGFGGSAVSNWENGQRSPKIRVVEDAINYFYGDSGGPFSITQKIANIIKSNTNGTVNSFIMEDGTNNFNKLVQDIVNLIV